MYSVVLQFVSWANHGVDECVCVWVLGFRRLETRLTRSRYKVIVLLFCIARYLVN